MKYVDTIGDNEPKWSIKIVRGNENCVFSAGAVYESIARAITIQFIWTDGISW